MNLRYSASPCRSVCSANSVRSRGGSSSQRTPTMTRRTSAGPIRHLTVCACAVGLAIAIGLGQSSTAAQRGAEPGETNRGQGAGPAPGRGRANYSLSDPAHPVGIASWKPSCVASPRRPASSAHITASPIRRRAGSRPKRRKAGRRTPCRPTCSWWKAAPTAKRWRQRAPASRSPAPSAGCIDCSTCEANRITGHENLPIQR